MEKFLLSVVIPVFNEEAVLKETVKRMQSVMRGAGWAYEIIFVNDGSKDASLDILKEEKKKDGNIRIISLSRNFGHQIAITAGLDYVAGDAAVIIDADLQDPPEVIPEMVKKWQEGYDIVHARRLRRFGESAFKRWTAYLVYRLIRIISNVDIPVDVGDFRLISRKALDSLKKIREQHRYVRGLVAWLGYKQTFIGYDRDKRHAGKSKYTLMKMIHFVAEGVTSFSVLPLKLATILGFLSSVFSFLYVLYALYAYLVLHVTVPGWATTVIAIFFLGGVQLLCLGIIGEYLGMVNDETKGRPIYIIDETV